MDVEITKLRIAVVQAVRAGLEKCKHHQAFSGRLKNPVRIEVEKVLPGAAVYLDAGEHRGLFSVVNVWGGKIAYDNRVHLSVPNHEIQRAEAGGWWALFEREIQRADESDILERWQALELLFPRFESLQAEVEKIREQAGKLIADLPVPAAADLRAENNCWHQAPYDLKAKFPLLFADVDYLAGRYYR